MSTSLARSDAPPQRGAARAPRPLLVSRESDPRWAGEATREVVVRGVRIGGADPVVIAGPCSVESLGQTLAIGVDRACQHLDRFGLEKMPRRVDAVDANVVERAATHLALRTDITRTNLHRERRIEQFRLAERT